MLARFAQMGAPVSTDLSYRTHTFAAVGGTSKNFSSIDVGAAHWKRYVVVAIGTHGGDQSAPASVTIGGVAATKAVDQGSNAGTYAKNESIWYALVPTGTTATIAITWSTSVDAAGVGVWRMVHKDGAVYDTGASDGGTCQLNTAAGGCVVAAGININNGTSTWTGATERFDADISSGDYHTGADIAESSEETNKTVGADNAHAKVAAAWS